MLKQLITFVITIAMVFAMPFTGIKANAKSGTITITQKDFDDAKDNPGESYNGISYNSQEDTFSIQAGDYALGSDISFKNGYWGYIEGEVNLNLNDYTFGPNMNIGISASGSKLTISGDGNVESYLIGAYQGTSLEIKGGDFQSVILSDDGSTVDISGGKFSGEVYARDENSTLTINGGTFNGKVYAEDKALLTIAAGVFNDSVFAEQGASLVIKGGQFESFVYGSGIPLFEISGGHFNYDESVSQCDKANITGGVFSGKYIGFSISECKSAIISGGEFSGGVSGLELSENEKVEISGGKFTGTGQEQGIVPATGISAIISDESEAETIFDDILAEGYEYTSAIKAKVTRDIHDYIYAYADQASFSVVKAEPDQPDDPDDPDDKGDDDDDKKDSGDSGDKQDGDKQDDDKKGDDKKDTTKYSNEWVDGKWYNADGTQTYKATLSWKQDATGWWVVDSDGWYPTSQWQKIDGKWYYFLADGYMDYSEYRDGCWLGADGAWDQAYSGGYWASDATGWWYTDASGWYPTSQWVWIDGSCYYFGADGYMATNQYVDGCWVGADGAWVK